jgi:hypothetical protein
MWDLAVPGNNDDEFYVDTEAADVLVHNDDEQCPVEITVSRSQYPESAQYIEDTQQAGQPQELTINRAGAAANRRAALEGVPRMPGLDRDEYPPAMFEEGGEGASVRGISPGDNRGAGSSIGNLCRGLENGTVVKIVVC